MKLYYLYLINNKFEVTDYMCKNQTEDDDIFIEVNESFEKLIFKAKLLNTRLALK